jgi:DNA-directed RNA polymerase subunit RPC12/RpoP
MAYVHAIFNRNPSSGYGVKTRGQMGRDARPTSYAFISCTSCKERIIRKERNSKGYINYERTKKYLIGAKTLDML